MKSSSLLFGVMSGTSLDGIDVVLVDMCDNKINIIDFQHRPYSAEIRSKILALHSPGYNELEESIFLSKSHAKITANCINSILKKQNINPKKIQAIGYHGQTLRHNPDAEYSIQIGDSHLLSELTEITVVSDFRNRDLVAGGQGAPLVPAFHKEIFSSKYKNRGIINIGGISNITYLPIKGSILGFDCGPGNILMDHWIKENKNINFDDSGKWAKSGVIIDQLLEDFLKEEFFIKKPPKSTGRELFNLHWLKNLIKKSYAAEDIQRTLLELTAICIVDNLKNFCNSIDELYICGGGGENKFLLERLIVLSEINIQKTDSLNIPTQQVETIAFAWLAKKTINSDFNNTPSVTGARGLRVLGAIHIS
jgi:anhydro-N-acetylmuramic acid kinase|tara:strand:- start:1731 stop:2825 length:1095 start_codon:yes stop_codon:yes gene_type:complete